MGNIQSSSDRPNLSQRIRQWWQRARSRSTRSTPSPPPSSETNSERHFIFLLVHERRDQMMIRHVYLIPYDNNVMASIISALSGHMTYEQLLELDEVDDGDSGVQMRGGAASEAIEQQLPAHAWTGTSEDRCVICLSEMKLGAACRRLPCEHAFHAECIEHWLNRRNVCPVCRQQAITS